MGEGESILVVFPENFNANSRAEERVYSILKGFDKLEWKAYFNYKISFLEADLILMVPAKGIVVAEIKDLEPAGIIKVKDNNAIIYRKSDGMFKTIPSPLKQADRYKFALLDKLKEEGRNRPVVISAVCYPYIDEFAFNAAGLKLICDRDFCILKEDLESWERFAARIEGMFGIYRRRGFRLRFDGDVLERVAHGLEKGADEPLKDGAPFKDEGEQLEANEGNPPYSKVYYISPQDGHLWHEIKSEALELWKRGAKIYIFSTVDIIEKVKEHFNGEGNLDAVQKSLFDDGFNIGFYPIEIGNGDKVESFVITDGMCEDGNKLKRLQASAGFNFEQYEIEHAPLDKDIMVKAGAGTGKTTTMINRIAFLVHKRGYIPAKIPEKIAMITFTNKAADNMKAKLQEYYEKMYKLTKNDRYFQIVGIIRKMQISTIDSFLRGIIERFGWMLGYSRNFSIIDRDSVYEEYINDALSRYVASRYGKNAGDFIQNNGVNYYNLKNILTALSKLLKQRNIDILNDSIDFGSLESNDDLESILKTQLKQMEQEMEGDLKRSDVVLLSDLVILAKRIIQMGREELQKFSNKVEYLFIDEFQDTDDSQIFVVSRLKEIYGFRLFVVGDIKQCIYRFRGADDNAFDRLKQEAANSSWMELRLSKNYRTDKELLDLLDQLFSKWSRMGYLADYSKLEGMKVYDKGVKKLIPKEYYDDEQQKSLVIEAIREIEKEIRKDIEEKETTKGESAKEEQREDEKKEYTIALLVRENRHVLTLKELCRREKIFVYTDVGGNLYQIKPTIDFYLLVRALRTNALKDIFMLYARTCYVKDRISKEKIVALKGEPEKLRSLLLERLIMKNWEGYLDRLKKEPPLKVLRDIIEEARPWENYAREQLMFYNNLPQEEKPSREYLMAFYRENLYLLVEKMVKYFSTDYLTLNKLEGFLKSRILTSDEDSREIDSEAGDEKKIKVYCMTVHKAKGLEFDYVILPEVSEEFKSVKGIGDVELIVLKKQNGYQVGYQLKLREGKKHNEKPKKICNNHYERNWSDEEEQRKKEETRILYVALTRAKRKVVILKDALRNNRNKGIKAWQDLLI